MPETVTRCTCEAEPGTCSATPAEHVRAAAEFVLGLATAFDAFACTSPHHVAERDQSAAVYRDVLALQGVTNANRPAVEAYAIASACHLATMALLPGGGITAATTAMLIVSALPSLVEMARDA